MNLIFRSNITSELYPDGVFHAHPELHVKKKQSIGLIEAQGLFILPGRLERELEYISGAISNGGTLSEEYAAYAMIFDEIKSLCAGDFSADNVHCAVRRELGSVCARILENTAVFKDKEYTVEFLKELGFKET